MRKIKTHNYLLSHRKRMGFYQEDVAFMLGRRGGTKISRLERLVRKPSLEVAIALEVIFQRPFKDLFRGLYTMIALQVLRRAVALSRRLLPVRSGRRATRRIESLARVINAIEREVDILR